jgi:hypothetical protein
LWQVKAALVALGLPLGLAQGPDPPNTAEGAPAAGGGAAGTSAADEAAADASRRSGECEAWTRGHELGRAAPLWTNGKGVTTAAKPVIALFLSVFSVHLSLFLLALHPRLRNLASTFLPRLEICVPW